MKRLYTILIVSALLLSLIAAAVFDTKPVGGADSGDIKKIGDKIVLATDIEATYLGKTPEGRDKYSAIIGEPKYLNDLTTPINCQWAFDALDQTWTMPDNFYEATVANTGVTIRYEGTFMFWYPRVYVAGKEVYPVSIYADRLPVDPVNENYAGNTLQWQYAGFTRNLRAIEGVLIEYYTLDKLPAGDIEIINNVAKSAGYTFDRRVSVYDANYEPVAFTSVDGDVLLTHEAMKSAVFPITIDPDSTFYASAADGHLEYQDAVWATARENSSAEGSSTGAYVMRVRAWLYSVDSEYRIERSYLHFDTSGLSDSVTITDAKLYCRISGINDDDDAKVYIVEGMPTYPHNPLQNADWDYTKYTFGTEYGYVDAGDLTDEAYEKINDSNPTALKGLVNKTGWTKLCLIERHDKVDETPASDEVNQVMLYTYDKGAGYRPYLVVSFTAVAPSITTDAASNIAVTTARLNSTVDDDGGDAVTVRFGWGESSEAAIVDYDNFETVAGTYTTGQHPYLDVDSLSSNTLYYFRVDATNDADSDLGGELSFTTENAVGDPSNFVGIPTDTTVSLTWTKGTGASNSVVRYGTSTYPVIPTGGYAVYAGTSSSTVHEGLTGGTTYYYAVWGESGGAYSTNNATLMVTTSATVTAGEDFSAPISPSRWLSAPDYTNLSGLLFLYDGINNSADSIGMPRETLWMVLAVSLSLGMGILAYMLSKGNLFIGIIGLTTGLVFGWIIQIVPFWIPLLSGIIIGAYAIGHREVKTY